MFLTKKKKTRVKRLFPQLSKSIDEVQFVSLDRENSSSVSQILNKSKYDLVVHTAGPFQGKVKTPNGVLAACVEETETRSSIPYIDVCDDYCTASAAQTRYHELAKQTNTPCIISTGCWVRTYRVFHGIFGLIFITFHSIHYIYFCYNSFQHCSLVYHHLWQNNLYMKQRRKIRLYHQRI